MHQLLYFKSKFSNHFAFTLECYLFLLIMVMFIYFGCRLWLHLSRYNCSRSLKRVEFFELDIVILVVVHYLFLNLRVLNE